MWHGSAIDELLGRFSPTQALARRVGSAHSGWELVLHMAVWAEIANARVDGVHTEFPAHDVDCRRRRNARRRWRRSERRRDCRWRTRCCRSVPCAERRTARHDGGRAGVYGAGDARWRGRSRDVPWRAAGAFSEGADGAGVSGYSLTLCECGLGDHVSPLCRHSIVLTGNHASSHAVPQHPTASP